MTAANGVVPLLLEGVSAELLAPPVNVLRLSLHPNGLARKIINLQEWRAHLLRRLKKQIEDTADEKLESLFDELKNYESAAHKKEDFLDKPSEIIIPLKIESKFGALSFISTTTVFGTPTDVTLAEIALETFFPADEPTAKIFSKLSGGN